MSFALFTSRKKREEALRENSGARERRQNLDTSIGWLLLLQVVLIALNAVFACAEIAVLSVNEVKLSKMVSEGNRKARRLSRLTAQPARFLATIQVAITLAGFLGSAFAAENFSDPLVDWLVELGVTIPPATLNTLAVILITLILSFFTLVFGELVPKRIAMKQSEKVALNISGLITVISKLFAPIVWLLSASTNGILRLLGIDPNEAEEQVGEEDIRMMVDASSEHGGIDHEEKEFIQNVFEFDDLTAEEIATHRTDVDLLWLDDTMDDWAETIHNTRHTRYPVCEDSADNVVGILNAKEYFRLADKSRESVMAGAVRTPYFVPETIKADALFRNMKRTGNPLAVVLDEYGGMVGIVTLNDLVEELVGDLGSDDSNILDDDEPRIEKREDGSLVITGNVELDDLEDALGIELDQEEHDTLTGLVFDALGMIPDDGPQDITLEAEGMRIHVTSILDHQVNAAEVTLLPQTEDADEAKE